MQQPPKYFNDYFIADKLGLSEWERLLNLGWDRVGFYFFRKRFDSFEGFNDNLDYIRVILELMPLRFRLNQDFAFSNSQKKIIKKNSDLKCVYRRATIDEEKIRLFDQWHFNRFKSESRIEQWVTGKDSPFPTMECCIYKANQLVACSYFDTTKRANYSTLAFYDPDESKRSLGTFTMIAEILYGIEHKKTFHYPGHAHIQSSMYDYKKQFQNGEFFNWEAESWQKLMK